ncbi:MAG: thermonuclease family protein [Nitrospirae bacterium]|nr:thermonuclease family protein [Nitrospirota bacterium]
MRPNTLFKKAIYMAILAVTLLIAVFRGQLHKPLQKSSSIAGRVVKVTDGDTAMISPEDGGSEFTCRLYGIDAPEIKKKGKKGQPYGEEAEELLKRLVSGEVVDVTLTGEKTYKREVCFITKDGIDINLEMVKRGYAWAYRQYLDRPYAGVYINSEEAAREKRLGLWKDLNPQPPWEFRKRK